MALLPPTERLVCAAPEAEEFAEIGQFLAWPNKKDAEAHLRTRISLCFDFEIGRRMSLLPVPATPGAGDQVEYLCDDCWWRGTVLCRLDDPDAGGARFEVQLMNETCDCVTASLRPLLPPLEAR